MEPMTCRNCSQNASHQRKSPEISLKVSLHGQYLTNVGCGALLGKKVMVKIKIRFQVTTRGFNVGINAAS